MQETALKQSKTNPRVVRWSALALLALIVAAYLILESFGQSVGVYPRMVSLYCFFLAPVIIGTLYCTTSETTIPQTSTGKADERST